MVVLPAPEGPTRAVSFPAGTWKSRFCSVQGSSGAPERRAEADPLEGDVRSLAAPLRGPDLGEVPGAGPLRDVRLEVQDLEDPVEADHGRHHGRLHARQLVDGAVEPHQQGDHGHEGAQRQGAVDGEDTAQPVDQGRGDRREDDADDAEDPSVDDAQYGDVADPARLAGEQGRLVLHPPVELGEHGARDVEALAHQGAHVAVELHPLPGDALEPARDQTGRQQEERDHRQGGEGDLPRQVEHRGQYQGQREEDRQRLGEQDGHRLPRPDDIGVQPADQRSGLRAGEERQ
jgi:hypothetical protein